jgi:hypothetical protein
MPHLSDHTTHRCTSSLELFSCAARGETALLYPVEVPTADSLTVATMTWKHNALNLRKINRNDTHTALASVLTDYGWVYSIFELLHSVI